MLTFGLLAVAFGYLDDELDDVRRLFGCTLILIGLVIVVPATLRLASDWPRMKPQHNVDLAFVQIAVGIAVLWVACALGGRAQAFMAPFGKPLPKAIPESQPGG
jgi:4-hydroxybenzoate polyprenyltransferase